LVTVAGCGSGDDAEVSTVGSSGVTEVVSSIGGEDGVESSIGSETPVAPTGLPLVEGVPVIGVLGPPEEGAGEVPLFRWAPVAGASRYTVAVIGPNGPLWAWQGEETEIYLGGLPFERPPGWPGPVIAPGSCWSVIARGDDGHVIAVGAFLPISPDDSAGHTCVPGSGPNPG
jgi:hypothetical protein